MSSGGLRAAFMHFALNTIVVDPSHPLSFLIERTTSRWKSRHMHSMEPTVQAGHLTSFHSGAPERLALEDSLFNQWSSNRGERQGAIFLKSAVLIGNVPVEQRTASSWESTGQLTAGTVQNAQPSQGWTRPPFASR